MIQQSHYSHFRLFSENAPKASSSYSLLRAIPLVFAFLYAAQVGYSIAQGNTTLTMLELGVFAVVLVWVQPLSRRAITLIIAFTTPGLLGLGSGLFYGMNMKTIFVLLVIIFLAFRYFVQKQRPVPTDLIVPLTIFILIHFLSHLNGVIVNPYTGFSFIGMTKVIRDLMAPWCLYLFIVFAELDEVWLRKLWRAFIGICVLSAAIMSFRWLTEFLSPTYLTVGEVRVQNLNPGFFEIVPIVYLLPLNLIIANLVYARLGPFQRVVRITVALVLFLAAISELQRAMILSIVVSLFTWLLILKPFKKKVIIVMTGSLLLLVTILSPLGTYLSQVVEYTTDPSLPGSEVAGIHIYSSTRLEKQWPMALAYWRERPLTGIGFGQVHLRAWFGLAPFAGGISAHSVYLGWLAESGIIGFIVGIWFFYRITKSLKQAWRSEFASSITREITVGLWVFWMSFLCNAIFNEFFWVSTWLFGFMMLLAACLTLISRRELVDTNASRIIRKYGTFCFRRHTGLTRTLRPR